MRGMISNDDRIDLLYFMGEIRHIDLELRSQIRSLFELTGECSFVKTARSRPKMERQTTKLASCVNDGVANGGELLVRA
jgi:hypothetical protein